MSEYIIRIRVPDNGYPIWDHDVAAEKRLTPEQQETVKFLYDRYHSAQASWKFINDIRAKFGVLKGKLDPRAQRKHERWTTDAEMTERMLAQSEPSRPEQVVH